MKLRCMLGWHKWEQSRPFKKTWVNLAEMDADEYMDFYYKEHKKEDKENCYVTRCCKICDKYQLWLHGEWQTIKEYFY